MQYVNFGSILMNQAKETILLCSNCHTDYKDLPQFCQHLRQCKGVDYLFKRNSEFKLDPDKGRHIIGKRLNGQKQYHVYSLIDIKDTPCANVKKVTLRSERKSCLDLAQIEKEIQDPNWYIDLTQPPNAADSPLKEPPTSVQVIENIKISDTTLKRKHTENKPNELNSESRYSIRSRGQITQNNAIKLSTKDRIINKVAQNITNNRKSMPLPKQQTPKRTVVPTVANSTVKMQKLQTQPISQNNVAAKPKLITPKLEISLSTTKRPKVTVSSPENIEQQYKSAKPLVLNSSSIKCLPTLPKCTENFATKSLPLVPPRKLSSTTIQIKPLADATSTNTVLRASANQTEQILSKLQTLGLQVKRTNVNSNGLTKKLETLDLLNKLKLKGIEIVNKGINKNGQTPNTTIENKFSNITKKVIIKRLK